jgi:hypothetical protein
MPTSTIKWIALSAIACFLAGGTGAAGESPVPTDGKSWTPPAYPLVACDPYFSIWSQGKSIVDCDTTHWTGKPHRLISLIRVDGKTYRLLGNSPNELPAFTQVSQQVLPTRSVILMSGAGVEVTLTFTTPALPANIDLLSRPITYVSYDLRAADGKSHEIQLVFAASGEIAVDRPDEQVAAENLSQDSDTILRVGSVEQNVLGRQGDDLRIDWGYLYLAARNLLVERAGAVATDEFFKLVEAGEPLPETSLEEAVAGGDVVLAVAFKPVTLRSAPVHQWLLLAYDDVYSIEFMQQHLQPYWRRNGLDGQGLVQESLRDYESLTAECESFDSELVDDLRAAGGPEYADIACLAYRQCFAAGKFVADANGQPLQFSKENHSNGCIGTSDVFYPMAPQFLLFGPSLAKSFVVPFMEYAESDRWKFPFAPHDLGTYPKANGQVYGGGETSEENQMPVEECGNMLLLMGAIAKVEGNADFAAQYWPTLVLWAEYLKNTGFDPESQLCTDDFAGHMAHNVNLSAKAICALGAFAQLCEMRGEHEMAQEYRQQAESFASRWMKEADDGDHYRLAFDKPGTWSQKYNLVWDRVLGLGLFPDSVLRMEMDYYKKIQNRYGLPLDNRREYTKLDWILWTATLTEDPADFRALVSPVHCFLNDTPDRSPMTDWYETKSGKKVGFTARPVVGGVFLRMLYDDEVWQKWAERDRTAADGYADLPKPPTVRVLVAAADRSPASWRYTAKKPSGDWQSPEYDDSTWQEGVAGFGTRETPGAVAGTVWNTPDIWLRRKFDVSEGANDRWRLQMHHDEDADVYINGVPARQARGYTTDYERYPIDEAALAAIRPSENVFAVHCHQTGGGQYIDVGIVTLDPADDGWISLFNGKDLTGWKASDHGNSFRVVDGELVIKGPRSHLFYTGPVGGADFTNFEWKCELLTKPSSNSGMYFHTEYQDEGWPAKGYEVQINNSHSDPKRTGGLYAVADVMHDSPVKDDEWFTEEVTVEGKHVVVSVDGQVTTDYTEPNDVQREPDFAGRKLSHGTIALQSHDPGSEVRIRKIMIKPLP